MGSASISRVRREEGGQKHPGAGGEQHLLALLMEIVGQPEEGAGFPPAPQRLIKVVRPSIFSVSGFNTLSIFGEVSRMGDEIAMATTDENRGAVSEKHWHSRERCDCLITAAGLSSRMGAWKLMLPYRQSTILDESLKMPWCCVTGSLWWWGIAPMS